MKKLGLLVALVCVMAMPVAKAGILLEPFVGYGFLSGDYDASLKGLVMGGRVGYEQMGFYGELEYAKYDLSGDITYLGTEMDADMDGHTLSAIVGYELPILLRVYGGYAFAGDSADSDVTGIIVGAGYKVLPLPKAGLYVNGEFRTISADNVDYKTFAVTVSVPFNI